MRRDHVEQVFHKPITRTFVERLDANYDVCPKGNWLERLLAKKLWSWLVKFGAVYPVSKTTFERIVFKPNDFGRALEKQFDAFTQFHSGWPKEILIGSEDFDKLMHVKTADFMYEWQFDLESAKGYQGRYGQRHVEYRSVPVRVIPHMRGVLVL